MYRTIQTRFDRLEDRKRSILSQVAQFSGAQMRFRAADGEWCVAEVLDHLIKVEKSWLGAVSGQLSSSRTVMLKDRVGAWFIIAVMMSPMKVKVPAGASMVVPNDAGSMAELVERWKTVREDIVALSGSLQPQQLGVAVFRHPVSGWMTMGTSLSFLGAHMRHHEYQLNRVVRSLKET